MPDCDYCDETFSDEEAYLQHLHAGHDESELSRIDQRRAAGVASDGGGGLSAGPVILVGLIVLTLAATVYVTFFLGGSGGASASGTLGAVQQTPTGVGSVHEHGRINVTIAGETLDFSGSEFQNPRQYPAFHFEGSNGEIWHKHARGVTLEYAMSTLGIEVNRTAVRYDGRLYRDSNPGTEVAVEVDGEPVDPSTYVLQGTQSEQTGDEADHVRIVVRTDG